MSKEFTIKEESGNEIKLMIRDADYEIIEGADQVYASKIASLIREGGKKKLLLRQELSQFLKDNGIWTDEDNDKINSLNGEIDKLLGKLRKGGIKLSKGRKIALDIIDKRKQIVQVMNKRRIFDDATIESVAESEKIDYLIYACTVYSDTGEHYWECFEDMKNDKLSNVYSRAATLTYEAIYGVDDQFEQRLPENRWLKKYHFVNDDLRYTDRKTGEYVDREGNPLIESEKAVEKNFNNLQGEIVEEAPFIED